MMRFGMFFLMAVLTAALMVPQASAGTYVVNGQSSDVPPVESTIPEHNPGPGDAPVIDEEFINFDDLTVGGTFGTGIVVSNEYLGQGITFEGEGEVLNQSGNFGISNFSAPNFLAFNTNAGADGPETFHFSPPVSFVSFFAGHSSAGLMTVEAYDSQNNLVSDETMNGGSALQEFVLTDDEIARVVVSFSGSVMCIDNITFDTAAPGPVNLTLFPINTAIPANGGQLVYDAQLISNLNQTFAGVSFWTEIRKPDNTTVGPLVQIPFTLTPFMNVFVTGMTQSIPANAPAGTYLFKAKVGYQNGPQVDDSFEFTKSGVSADGVVGWGGSGFDLAGEDGGLVMAPTDYALQSVYPNPFNAMTTVRVALPEASELNVAVYNSVGQLVSELVNGQVTAGLHAYSFDAGNHASGLYFVRAMVPGQMNQTQKVMLVR